jgi:hypothetical protein
VPRAGQKDGFTILLLHGFFHVLAHVLQPHSASVPISSISLHHVYRTRYLQVFCIPHEEVGMVGTVIASK